MHVLVVGAGYMGSLHANTLRRLGHRVTTIDPRPDAQADLLSIPRKTQATHAVVATPAEHTAATAALLLDRGYHVLAEKPLAPTVSEALELAQHPDIHQLRVGYLERLNPAVSCVKAHLSLVGRVRHINAHRLGPQPGRSLTNCLLDLASHDLDVVRNMGWSIGPPSRTEQDGHCTLTAGLQNKRGQLATLSLEASYIHPRKHRTLSVVGDQGMLSCDYQTQTVAYTTEDDSAQLPVEKGEPLAIQHTAWLEQRLGLARIRDAIAVLATLSTPAEASAA